MSSASHGRNVISTSSVFYHEGRVVKLGEKLGSGGEGSVYAAHVGGQDLVAKIYHQPLQSEQHDKLISMVNCGTEALRAMSAWPVGLLQARRTGEVRGFLMPRLINYQAVHAVYGPAQRKADYPRADWAFLVQVARNIAAAFDTIHAHGHIIGDVNQGNVFVADNALVKLIDCDSFQISTPSAHFSCDVGVPHFVAPELQRLTSLRGLKRTVQHDNFALAVLVFHLLLMGRHPFAGIHRGAQDMPIERAIKEARYAFGCNAAALDMARPPGCVGPEILSAEVAELFEQAFGRNAEPAGRASAQRWVQALDLLRQALRSCNIEPMHRYYGKLASCPWCDLEARKGVVFFVGAVSMYLRRPSNFDVEASWARIAAVTAPTVLPVSPGGVAVSARPLPQAVRSRFEICALGAIMVVAGGLLAAAAPRMLWVWVLLVLLFWWGETNGTHIRERARRQRELELAQIEWDYVVQNWHRLAGQAQYTQKLQQLLDAKHEYEHSDEDFFRARQQLQQGTQTRAAQLQKFLAQFHIERSAPMHMTQDQSATLTAHGFCTAADLDWVRMSTIRPFLGDLPGQLMAWRRQLEQQFRFDATCPVSAAELQALARRFAERRSELAALLSAGPQQLQRVVSQHEERRRALLGAATQAARRVAQARADWSVVS